MSDYGLKKRVPGTIGTVEAKVRDALAEEGFGVLTEIDVRGTLQAKLGVEFRPYRILGACNPTLAHRALGEEIDIGLLLPCNVVVYEGPDPDQTEVAILDPVKQLAVAERDDLEPLALEVRGRMERVLASL